MKKIIAIIISIVIICLNVFELIHAGFFRDAHPNINIAEVESYFFWGSFFLSIAFLMTILIAVLVCLNIFVGVKYYSIVKDCSLKKVEETDYIASEHLRSTSLDELQ